MSTSDPRKVKIPPGQYAAVEYVREPDAHSAKQGRFFRLKFGGGETRMMSAADVEALRQSIDAAILASAAPALSPQPPTANSAALDAA